MSRPWLAKLMRRSQKNVCRMAIRSRLQSRSLTRLSHTSGVGEARWLIGCSDSPRAIVHMSAYECIMLAIGCEVTPFLAILAFF